MPTTAAQVSAAIRGRWVTTTARRMTPVIQAKCGLSPVRSAIHRTGVSLAMPRPSTARSIDRTTKGRQA